MPLNTCESRKTYMFALKWTRLESRSLIYLPKRKTVHLYLVVCAFYRIMELCLKQIRHHGWELVVEFRRMLCGVEQDRDGTSVCGGNYCEKPHKKLCRITVLISPDQVRRKMSWGSTDCSYFLFVRVCRQLITRHNIMLLYYVMLCTCECLC